MEGKSDEQMLNNQKPPTSKLREEGELSSSSDGDALPKGSAAPPQPSHIPNAPSPFITASAMQPPVNSGKFNSVPAGRTTQIKPQKSYHKGFSKKRVFLKSSNSGWRAPGANDNLVISFSDDDSGSEDEERRKENDVVRDKPPLNSIRKPPTLPHVKPQNVIRNLKNEGKVMPPKVSTCRTFTPSRTKIQESSVRSGASALVEQKFRLKNSNVAGRSLPNPDHGCSKNLDMSGGKLEDLRQQIAARENELKLKLVEQNKENVDGANREANTIVQKEVASRKCKSVPVDTQTEPKEPDRKRLKTHASGVAGSCSLSDWVSLPKQTALLMNTTHADPLERSHPVAISKNQPSRSAPNQDIHGSNMSKADDNLDITSALRKLKSTSDSGFQDHALQVSKSKFEGPDVSPDNTNLLHHLGRSTALANGDVDLRSLFEAEELHDKELEEAQEHRRICEVEERNALNAYRRAQRALLEANARCTYLYRKRELYSAQLRSFLMEDTRLLYSSRQHKEKEIKWDVGNNFSDVNLDVIPSNHQFGESKSGNQLGYDSKVQSADGDAQNVSSANEDGHNLGSEACSEPDASTSELSRGIRYVANGTCSPSCDPTFSPDNDHETFSLNQRSLSVNVACPKSKDTFKESEKDIYVYSATNCAKHVSHDPLLLEEYLRSKLISRLGANSIKRSGISDHGESSAGRTLEEGVALIDPSASALDCRADLKDSEGNISKPLSGIQNLHVEEHNFNGSATSSPGECRLSADHIFASITFSTPIIRSVMKAAGPVMLDSVKTKKQHYGSPDTCYKDKLCSEMESAAEHLVIFTDFGKIDSYTNNCAVNSFWPLCIYELRGRCNNDECPWQHVKDYSDSDGCRAGLASNCQNPLGQTEVSCIVTPPKYLVCLDSLKDESSTYGSRKDCYFGSSGKCIFSRSLAVSSSVTKHIPSNEPCLHGHDGCVEAYGGSGLSMFFHRRTNNGDPLPYGAADNDQLLEMALLIVSEEVNKIEGLKKALNLLSRALEAYPSSFTTWIIYLILYCSTKYSSGEINKENSIQDEDLLSHAVKHSDISYELWLMYINSRGCLDERLSAYERALSRLCYYASSDGDGPQIRRSSTILDLFLQMMYSFCVSGNVTKALNRIHGLFHADCDSDESHSLLFSDILQCLTMSDKCIFWICCVYLMVYRKLPDSLVQQFEVEKDISSIEWPCVDLTVEEKQHVSKLMEMALDSVVLFVSSSASESSNSTTLQSSLPLAVNHIKLTAAIYGVERCRLLLEKYHSHYSLCLELNLILARAHDSMGSSSSLEKFKELATTWPKYTSGSQCIWNQYAELALMKGKPDRAKEIMDQWFHSDGVAQLFQNQLLNGENSDDKSISTDLLSVSSSGNMISNYSNMDLVFGLLNLSLYKLFHNDVIGAYSAVDRALKISDAEMLMHCVKEHAAFLFNNGSQMMKDLSIHGLMDILKGYFVLFRAIPVSEPLTRSFIQNIRKPRTRQLVRNILSPNSPDPSWINSILEIWFGPSLLPEKFDHFKDMVDYVEAILEVSPANYRLAISVCKLICRDSSDFSTFKSASVFFWASSLLVNTIYHAIPLAPEHIWVEAADMLVKLTSVQEICDSFHQRALSVHPFSVKLWKSFLNHSTDSSKRSFLAEAAREKGLQL